MVTKRTVKINVNVLIISNVDIKLHTCALAFAHIIIKS